MTESLALPSMSYFAKQREASTSSPNTRQRDHFERSHPCFVQLRATATSNDLKTNEVHDEPGDSSALGQAYPASELPFASEPALETELETELPPLKKLRPTRYNGGLSDEDDSILEPIIIIRNAVKGILRNKKCSSPGGNESINPPRGLSVAGLLPRTPPLAPTKNLEPHLSPLAGNTDFHLTLQSLSSLATHGFSAPDDDTSAPDSPGPRLWPHSFTGTSTNSSYNTIKAVRFASSQPISRNCEHQNGLASSEDEELCRCGQGTGVEGPVAAVIYLTHSAEAYDRTSIQVDKSLRMPPKQNSEDSGRWLQCGDLSGQGLHHSIRSRKVKRLSRGRVNKGMLEVENRRGEAFEDAGQLSIQPTTSSYSDRDLLSSGRGSGTDLQHFRTRDQCEDDDTEDDDKWLTAVDDGGAPDFDGDENSEAGHPRDGLSGFLNWSGPNPLDYDDVLGGF